MPDVYACASLQKLSLLMSSDNWDDERPLPMAITTNLNIDLRV
jgi:hypothetical protein